MDAGFFCAAEQCFLGSSAIGGPRCALERFQQKARWGGISTRVEWFNGTVHNVEEDPEHGIVVHVS